MRPFKNTRPSVSPLRQLLVSGLSTDAHGHKPDTEIYTVKLPDGRSIHTFRLSTAFTGSKEAIGSEKQHVKSPIVLIHGFAAGLGLWFQLLPYLALTGRDVYALDLPGVGSSSDIDQDTLHSFRGQSRGSKCTNATKWYTSAIESWLQVLGLDKVVLIGHSFGAYISAHYAIAHPERVDKLILLSPVGLTSSSAEEPDTKHEEALVDAIIGYIWCKWQITPLALARAVGPILLPRLIKAFVQKTNLFATVEPNDRKALWQYIYSLVRVKSSMEYLMPLCIHARGDAVDEPLDLELSLDVPGGIVIVRGGQDWATPLPPKLSQSAKISMLNLPEASHSMQIDNAKELFKALQDHL